MLATLENIEILSKIKMGKIVMTVTNITNKDISGFHIYKDKQRHIFISKSNFSNPYYLNNYELLS